MNKKILIGAGILLTVFVLFLILLSGGSGANNVLPEEELTKTIESVTCEVQDDDSVNYNISLISNDIQFDNEITSKNYTKIKANKATDFQTLGVAFLVKAEDDTTFQLSLMKNDTTLKSTSVEVKSGVIGNVDLVLESAVEISSADEFYISISNTSNSNFVFDTIIFFFDEV